jgi:hypothetical protein
MVGFFVSSVPSFSLCENLFFLPHEENKESKTHEGGTILRALCPFVCCPVGVTERIRYTRENYISKNYQ